ncbi:MAG TPA: asparagine synthase (glutamine-hydrolyzing) [Candidatus Sulfotelmatobacter sp.]|nr:asparagine synthase (glutamine-hydrolyzing) [Candidatus Sulfotelmatobacter sp.]
MCGIAGIFEFDRTKQIDPGVLRRMCSTIAHRGPDDEGFYIDGNLGMAMRRLSIIDLKSGHQPISNEDGTAWIVFNGEIYNQSVLREQLEKSGHRFRSRSDTEVIVHLYEEYGVECLKHLDGMFAFAIWDAKQHQLMVARDRLGIKPLYFYLTSERMVFASEIKTIFATGLRPEFRRASLPEYLSFGYLSGAETFYEGVRKLMPGHYMVIDRSGESIVRQYWDLSVPADENQSEEHYYVETYRELLERAVRSHLMSDAPVGVFLSGGIDSSAIAALMTRLNPTPINTFSVGYAEEQYSELPYARLVSQHLGSNHREIQVSQNEFFKVLPKLIWHEDEPIVWPSSVSLYFVARLAQQHAKVVLTGEGSDETLGGYSRYGFTIRNAVYDRLYRRCLPQAARYRVRHFISSSSRLDAGVRRKLSHTFLARDGQSWASFYFDNFFSAFNVDEQRGILQEDLANAFEPASSHRHVLNYWNNSSGDMLQRLLYTDIKTYLVELLMKQDNMSMAASVESRVPFLDHKLVEFAMSIPQRFQLRGSVGKNVLKTAMKGLLPDSILHRKKLGFPTPWSRWLAGPRLELIDKLLSEPRSSERQLFRPRAVERLFAEHKSRYRDNTDRIWRLLNLELWHRVCIEGEPVSSSYLA